MRTLARRWATSDGGRTVLAALGATACVAVWGWGGHGLWSRLPDRSWQQGAAALLLDLALMLTPGAAATLIAGLSTAPARRRLGVALWAGAACGLFNTLFVYWPALKATHTPTAAGLLHLAVDLVMRTGVFAGSVLLVSWLAVRRRLRAEGAGSAGGLRPQ